MLVQNNKALIVNDVPGVQVVLNAILEHAGFQSTIASTPQEAISRLQTQPVLFMLIDLQDLGEPGQGLLHEVCSIDASLPVLCLGLSEKLEDIIGTLPVGNISYIQKPVGARQLMAMVENLLEKK